MRKISRLYSLLALVLLVGACASTGSRNDEGEVVPISIVVENTASLSSDLTVYVVSRGGGRQILGSVPPNRTVTLPYSGVVSGGTYRLLARPNGGRDIVSNSFVFGSPGSSVRWNVYSNVAVPIS
jgi:hypothetical protein